MRKSTLLALAGLCITTTAAASIDPEGLSLQSEKNYENVLTADNAALYGIVAAGDDSTSFAAGCFDTAFNGLTPVAVSAYVMKNDAQMEPLWTVALQGAATVLTMTSDNDGGVYVAGQFADEVILNSTDGTTKTISGYQEWGAYTTDEVASFIAHYDKDGKLLAANTLLPTNDEVIDKALTDNPEGFFLGYNECYIKKLVLSDGNLYALINFAGQLYTTDNTASVNSGSADAYGMGYYLSQRAGTVATLDADLNVTSFLATVKTRPLTDETSAVEAVSSVGMDVADGHLYLAFISHGTTSLITSAQTEVMEFPLSDDGYVFGYGIADISLSDVTIASHKSSYVTTNYQYPYTKIQDVEVAGGKVVVSGVFQDKLGFAPSVTSTGERDLFIALFNQNDLDVVKAAASAFDEGDTSSNGEDVLSAGVAGSVAYVAGAQYNTSTGDGITSLLYAINLDGTDMTQHSADEYVGSIAGSSDGSRIFFSTAAAPFTAQAFSVYGAAATGIKAIGAQQTESGAWYDITGRRVANPAQRGIYIQNGKKIAF